MSINFLIGRKIGMTRVFDDFGTDYPVTILEAGPCAITQVKDINKEGYSAVQIGFMSKSKKHIKKAEKGHFDKANVAVQNFVKEVRLNEVNDVKLGQTISVDIFNIGECVSVLGTSKGKGFAGHMKRHGFSGGRRSHGKNSVMRKPGSVGAGTDPSRIWPGTRMAGRMGNMNVNVKNLEIVKIDLENHLVFVKGSVPGFRNGIVYISKIDKNL